MTRRSRTRPLRNCSRTWPFASLTRRFAGDNCRAKAKADAGQKLTSTRSATLLHCFYVLNVAYLAQKHSVLFSLNGLISALSLPGPRLVLLQSKLPERGGQPRASRGIRSNQGRSRPNPEQGCSRSSSPLPGFFTVSSSATCTAHVKPPNSFPFLCDLI